MRIEINWGCFELCTKNQTRRPGPLPMLKHCPFSEIFVRNHVVCIPKTCQNAQVFLGSFWDLPLAFFLHIFYVSFYASWLGLLLAECGRKIYGLHVKETLSTLSEMIWKNFLCSDRLFLNIQKFNSKTLWYYR